MAKKSEEKRSSTSPDVKVVVDFAGEKGLADLGPVGWGTGSFWGKMADPLAARGTGEIRSGRHTATAMVSMLSSVFRLDPTSGNLRTLLYSIGIYQPCSCHLKTNMAEH